MPQSSRSSEPLLGLAISACHRAPSSASLPPSASTQPTGALHSRCDAGKARGPLEGEQPFKVVLEDARALYLQEDRMLVQTAEGGSSESVLQKSTERRWPGRAQDRGGWLPRNPRAASARAMAAAAVGRPRTRRRAICRQGRPDVAGYLQFAIDSCAASCLAGQGLWPGTAPSQPWPPNHMLQWHGRQDG